MEVTLKVPESIADGQQQCTTCRQCDWQGCLYERLHYVGDYASEPSDNWLTVDHRHPGVDERQLITYGSSPFMNDFELGREVMNYCTCFLFS